MSADDVRCPFCGEGGYDLIGLKQHLEGTFLFSGACEAYTNTEHPEQERQRWRDQQPKEGAEG